jgi:hypothetical protein
MAVVILGGLVTSTVLNLFVVPVLYLRVGRPARPEPVGGPAGPTSPDPSESAPLPPDELEAIREGPPPVGRPSVSGA